MKSKRQTEVDRFMEMLEINLNITLYMYIILNMEVSFGCSVSG